MPIQLDKILADIAQEKVLHPNYPPAGKKEVDDAWARVGKNNKLSVHEARSIFKVLQKKYEQEKTKHTPSWKLFDLMEQIHETLKEEPKREDDGMVSMEEDEEYEMLEVQEEEEPTPAQTKGAAATSDGESPTKSMRSSGSTDTTPEKEEKPLVKIQTKASSVAPVKARSPAGDEKKLLNSLAPTRPATSANTPAASNTPSAAATNAATAAAAAALHKKGITMKKTSAASAGGAGTPSSGTPRSAQATSSSDVQQQKRTSVRIAGHGLGVGETIQLPESIKRKLVETQPTGPQPSKKPNTGQSTSAKLSSPKQEATEAATSTAGSGAPPKSRSNTNANSANAALQESTLSLNNSSSLSIKQEPGESAGINLITIPGNSRVELTNGGGGASSSTAATMASTSTNGYSPRLEEIDFRNDIIFDAGNGPINGAVAQAHHPNAPGGIINLGNFDNSLPPTFFKNLCNSSRHEALGLYVANVMNRLRARSAAKLELGILRAIIDVQSDELEQ